MGGRETPQNYNGEEYEYGIEYDGLRESMDVKHNMQTEL